MLLTARCFVAIVTDEKAVNSAEIKMQKKCKRGDIFRLFCNYIEGMDIEE